MFDVSYHKSFIFLLITIDSALSVVSRLYISCKLINFELGENPVRLRSGSGLEERAGGLVAEQPRNCCCGRCSAPLVRVLPPAAVGSGGPASPAPTPRLGSWCGQQK